MSDTDTPGFPYSTRPPESTLKPWFQSLDSQTRTFLAGHPLSIPFVYYGGYPGQFAAACLTNAEVQQNCREWPECHKLDNYAKYPVFRMEFEMGVAFGALEVLDWAKKKTWGPLDWIAPLLPTDPVHPMMLEFCHNPATSVWHQRLLQKQWLKRTLGGGGASMVHDARKASKEEWVGRLTTGIVPITWKGGNTMMVPDESIIQRKRLVKTRSDGCQIFKGYIQREPDLKAAQKLYAKLYMTPEEFWRAARCLVMLTPEQRRVKEQGPQRRLFDAWLE